MSVLTKAAAPEHARDVPSPRAALLLTTFLFPAGYAALGSVTLLAAAIVIVVRGARALWHRTPLDVYLALFVLSLSLSAVFSPFPSMAMGSTVLLVILIALAFGGTVVSLTSSATLLPLLWALGAGTMVAALWGSISYAITGLPAHTPVIGYNALGTTLATGLPILLGLTITAEGRARLAAGAGAVLTFIGLALTFSRGAWLGGAVGLLLLLLFLRRLSLRPTLLLLAAGLLAGGLVLAQAVSTVKRAGSPASFPTIVCAVVWRVGDCAAARAVEDRLGMWGAALAILQDRPLLGTGLNTFGLVYPAYRPPEARSSPEQPFAHNIVLNMAAEGGILGLGAFLAVLIKAAGLGFRWLTRGGNEKVLAASVLAAAAALFAHQQVDGTALSFHIGFGPWLLLGIVAARGAVPRGRI